MRAAGKANADGVRRSRPRDRAVRGIPVPEANAELQANLDVCHMSFFFNQLIVLLELRVNIDNPVHFYNKNKGGQHGYPCPALSVIHITYDANLHGEISLCLPPLTGKYSQTRPHHLAVSTH